MSNKKPIDENVKKLNEFIDKNQDVIDRINKSIMDRQFHPINSVYLDLQTLKDTRMGLMLHLSTPETMQYLKNGLERYNKRPNRKFLFAYPDFPYTENQLQEMYHDKELSDEIFNRSPDTDLLYDLKKIFTQIQQQNHKAGNNRLVTVHINLWPLKETELTKLFAQILGYQMHPQFFRIKTLSQDPATLSTNFWLHQDFLFIDNLEQVTMEESGLRRPLLFERQYMNKTVFAAPQVSDEVLQVWKDEGLDFNNYEAVWQRFELTSIYFSVCCIFSFMPFVIPLPKK